jgi:hypothetical protein
LKIKKKKKGSREEKDAKMVVEERRCRKYKGIWDFKKIIMANL